MLSIALSRKPKRSPRAGECSLRSTSYSVYGYDEFVLGTMDDIPLTPFDEYGKFGYNWESAQMTLKQVLRGSVGVLGESPLGMSEKAVFLGGNICAVKRFRSVIIRKSEFRRRIERLAQVGNQGEYLVPVSAYLYTKRIKFVICAYYPMGSLADLLAGARELGQTALEWKHRLKIVECVAQSIGYIHAQNPSKEKHLQVNVHGNIKSSNVMIHIDFSAHLSNYGFLQLAQNIVDVDHEGQMVSLSPPPERSYDQTISREGDIFNFGVVLMDILGWPDKVSSKVEGKEQKQALELYEIALECTKSLAEARPTIEQILSRLKNIEYV